MKTSHIRACFKNMFSGLRSKPLNEVNTVRAWGRALMKGHESHVIRNARPFMILRRLRTQGKLQT
jgi:hypothetical protein